MASIPPCWRRVHRDLQEHAPALMALSKKRRAAALSLGSQQEVDRFT
jgi:hypothetical protein